MRRKCIDKYDQGIKNVSHETDAECYLYQFIFPTPCVTIMYLAYYFIHIM